jgi:colanic acid biosynthesis protein WcaH
MSAFIDQELYDAILRHMPIACVDVAIVYNGCVLLVRREDSPAKGEWWVPGGRVIKGETLRETARRKAREEVGLDCHVGPIIHTAETIFTDGPGGIPVHSINTCFLLYPTHESTGLCVTLDHHHTAWRWADSITDELHPYVARCLQGAGLEG